MAQMPDKIRDASLRAQESLADERTPFLRDAWYVAALGSEVGRTPLARRLLDVPVVLYRLEDGTPVALEDRCAHRSFPLSKGTLEGDRIVCGYHGAQYDAEGVCRKVPSQTQTPSAAVVRNFALHEAGRWLWIWMGEAARADFASLPHAAWMSDSGWVSSTGYMPLKASYVRLHENLLDLTHLSFLHANTFGTPDYATAPFETDLDDAAGVFRLIRSVMPTRLPPLWAEPTGLSGVDAARITESTFHGPGLHVVQAHFFGCDRPESEQPHRAIRTAHIVTPETPTSTHYFIQHARNFALDDDRITQFMHDLLMRAFNEDVEGLEAVEATLAGYRERQPEISFRADTASLMMRRWLKRRAEAAGPAVVQIRFAATA